MDSQTKLQNVILKGYLNNNINIHNNGNRIDDNTLTHQCRLSIHRGKSGPVNGNLISSRNGRMTSLLNRNNWFYSNQYYFLKKFNLTFVFFKKSGF